jgi:hypothetical protein
MGWPDYKAAVRPINLSGNNAQTAMALLRRTFAAFAERDRPQAWNEALRILQLGMAVHHATAGGDEALQSCSKLLESGVAGASADPRSGANPHHPGLQLCDLGERGVNRILDGANLRRDFKGGLFNNLFAHDLLHSGCGKTAFRLFEQG